MSRGSGDDDYFTVRVRRKEVVAAALPTQAQEYWLPLSNLDLLLPPLDVGLFLCYRKPQQPHDERFSFESMVMVLKESMALALVPYYAFGGEVVLNSVGEPELLCNNRGVDFMEAYADIKLKDLNLYNPDQSIEGKLVPKKKNGVLSVQVTELKCGGVVVGCTFDHRIADAYSTNMFLISWAEMAQCKPLSVIPTFRRSLLNPRRPAVAVTVAVSPSIDNLYILYTALPPPPPPLSTANINPLISRLFYVTSEHLLLLQTLASATTTTTSNSKQRTKLESLSAFLWKMVAKSTNTTAAESADHDQMMMSKMGIVVDGRQRLISCSSSSTSTGEMASYFGNVLSIPFGEKSLQELIEKPLDWIADAIHEYLQGAATKEHFLELIDWVEAHLPVPALTKIYCSSSSHEPAFVMSSGKRFPVSKLDFGWGRPALGSYHFPWGGATGYVMPMPSPAMDGDWLVYMHLLKTQIEFIEKEAAHIFKPLTSEYLKLI